MTVKEWYRTFEERLSPSLSCEWDRDGIQCAPNPEKTVNRILCTLDVTERVAKYAVENEIDLIISHHPLLFRPLYALSNDAPVERALTLLVKHDIALFSFHTRTDAVDGGVADLLANRIGLQDVRKIETEEGPLLRIGTLKEPMHLADYADYVRTSLETDAVLLSTDNPQRLVSCVAVSGGEGGDFVSVARANGADLYVSGRIGYHRVLEGCDGGMAMLEAGHYFTEREIVYFFAAIAQEAERDVDVVLYAPKGPMIILGS